MARWPGNRSHDMLVAFFRLACRVILCKNQGSQLPRHLLDGVANLYRILPH